MKTPLYDQHVALGAKMTEFADWSMPLYYSSITDEVLAVRNAVGIFDLSHMGEFIVSGDAALELLQLVVTNDVSKLEIGQAQYNLLCDETGGVLDDLIVYRLGQGLYMPVVNASNIAQDFSWMCDHNEVSADIQDKSAETALIAIQGPNAFSLMESLTGHNYSDMKRFHIVQGSVSGVDAWIASTGYTGSAGFELYCQAGHASAIWNAVMDAGDKFGAKPIGLGARDVLRVEAGYPLYGHELDRETTPLDAGLMWAVKLNKKRFIGKDAIATAESIGAEKCLVGLEAIDRCIPRHGYNVVVDQESIGQITSGTFSPTLQKAISMAYIKPDYAEPGRELSIDVRGKTCASRVVPIPFYRQI